MLTFIVNRTAGNGYAARVERQLRDEVTIRGIPAEFHHTDCPGHATSLAREAASHADCTGVIAVGGDGTSFEVACGLLGTHVPLGIIPAGTGNDFVKSTGSPTRPLEALDFILSRKPRTVDICSLNDRMFLNVSGAGFDVTVLDYTLAAKKYVRGILPYLIGLVRAVFHHKKIHVRLTIDGKESERDVLICSVANGRYIGGGIPICPAAKIDDGKLDVVMVQNVPRWKIPPYLPGLMMGKILTFKITDHLLCDSITIESPGMRFNVDGEIFSMDRAELRIQPGRLLLFW